MKVRSALSPTCVPIRHELRLRRNSCRIGTHVGDKADRTFITYMRTDSTRVAPEALDEVRELIASNFGQDFLPQTPNVYKSKKDAQEAHEAIRPSSVTRHP